MARHAAFPPNCIAESGRPLWKKHQPTVLYRKKEDKFTDYFCCIGVRLNANVDDFSSLQHCKKCDGLKVTLCLICHLLCCQSFYDIQQKYVTNIEEKNNDIGDDTYFINVDAL